MTVEDPLRNQNLEENESYQGSIERFHVMSLPPLLEGKNKTFSLLWEIWSIFIQNCYIVSALQHDCRENPLLHALA